MNDQLRNLLVLGGVITAGYFVVNKLTSDALPLDLTSRICQQIKHQMLIVTINFAEGSKQNIENIRKKDPSKLEEVYTFFRTKLTQIYEQKEQLILGKYGIPKEKYSLSLQKYASNPQIKKNMNQILEMMERAVNGDFPDLTVDKQVKAAFGKKQMKKIYEDMSKMILVALISKLQQEKKENPNFDSNTDADFKKAIKQLNIYAKKIKFFESKGFKPEWGCPNENFFKYNQGLKIQDPSYKTQMLRLEKIYELVVDQAAKDPQSVNLQKLNDFYEKQPEQPRQKIPIKVTHPLKKEIKMQTIQKAEPKKQQKKEQQPIKTVPVVVKQNENIVNVETQTKSEPQNIEEGKDKTEQNKQEQINHEHHLKARSLEQPLEEISVKVENQQQKKVSIDDVPNDAQELINQQQKEHQNVENNSDHRQEAESNVSVNGEGKNNQETHHEEEHKQSQQKQSEEKPSEEKPSELPQQKSPQVKAE